MARADPGGLMIGTKQKIVVREPMFVHESGAGGLWNPRLPELSHTLNGFQLALPYLEPYFIDAIRGAREHVKDEALLSDMQAFCDQEAHHSRQHRAYGRVLRQRYPRLAELETRIQQSLVQSRRSDTLEWRLAYTAGYEALTAQLARWLFKNQERWFQGADPYFAGMMTWHAAEEIEHRHVAFDVLSAVNDRHGLRAKGMFAALRKTYEDLMPAVAYMLEVDGYTKRWDSRVRRLGVRFDSAANLLPAVIRYLIPGYHPAQDREPAGFASWQRENTPRLSEQRTSS
jgi:predicted metal-dependent hydrolase